MNLRSKAEKIEIAQQAGKWKWPILFILLTAYILYGDAYYNFGYKVVFAGSLMAFAALACVLVSSSLFQKEKLREETLLLAFFVPLSLYAMLSFPLGTIPDESSHLERIYFLSTGQMLPGWGTTGNLFSLPSNLLDGISTDTRLPGWREIFTPLSDSTNLVSSNFATGIYPITSYIFQTIGMKLVSVFTNNRGFLFYGARLGGWLATCAGLYFAMRLLPKRYRHILLMIVLIPSTLMESAGASADGITIAVTALLTAFVLNAIENKPEFRGKDIVLLFLLTIMTIGCKFLYSPLIFLSLAIPSECFGGKKKKRTALTSIILIGILLIIGWTVLCYIKYIREQTGTQMDGVLPQLIYVLKHPISYVFIILHTLLRSLYLHLIGAFGAEFHISGNMILPFFAMISAIEVIIAGKKVRENQPIDKIILPEEKIQASQLPLEKSKRRLFLGLSAAAMFVVFIALYLEYTPYQTRDIWGIQGRYYIPVLLPALTALLSAKGRTEGIYAKNIVWIQSLAVLDLAILTCNLSYVLIA